MGEPIISVRQIGKRYRLGQTLAHDTLRDHLTDLFKSAGNLFTGKWRQNRREDEYIWALKDISFDVEAGEVVGIIGRNGAGKSTLLKILSQITEPTEGEARVRGRLASLLEVGTGFHQELTGRENIFLNGAILGMSKSEIKKKFDEIVAFAEVEKFLDTPVKRYSSGMYVRLAFAVAAHLEPEILVVDEVLAVGDAAFQNKCLGKMQEVARGRGRTVFFVSHNMSAIQTLCSRVIYLSQGRIKGIGSVEEQISAYLKDLKTNGGTGGEMKYSLGENFTLNLLKFSPNPIVSGSDVEFQLKINPEVNTTIFDLQILIYSIYGVRVGIIDLRQPDGKPYILEKNKPLEITGKIKSLPLVEGDYRIGIYLYCNQYYRDFNDITAVSVAARPNQTANVPCKPIYRGIVEFDTTFEASVG
ncbi:MAG: ABC transporter ATP-binding protein [Verrucomicrobiia bacterium]